MELKETERLSRKLYKREVKSLSNIGEYLTRGLDGQVVYGIVGSYFLFSPFFVFLSPHSEFDLFVIAFHLSLS